MDRYKYLLKNISVLALSSMATKLLAFFLVPLYTNILVTEEYGLFDAFGTTISVLVPVLTLGIHESVLCFALDHNFNRKAIVAIGLRYLIISNAIVAIGLLVNYWLGFSPVLSFYAWYFFFMFFTQALSAIVVSYVRGIGKITELSISSIIASVMTIIFNILFLVVFKWGLVGYFLANTIGPLLQCVYLIFVTGISGEISFKEGYKEENKAMVEYATPMIANNVAWWVNNTSDRYVIILFCGLAENGIYSVASKIPSILHMFQVIFNQAWALSAVRDFDPEDKNGFFSNTYKLYNCFMVMACSGIILTSKILAKFLYAKDFYAAWQYVPWLTIAIVFGSLSGYISGFFSAVKNAKIHAQSSVIGAVLNIVLNLIFTPFMRALGAAIATFISYFVVWLLRYQHSKKFIKMKISIYRDMISYAILVMQASALNLISDDRMLYTVLLLLMLGLVLINAKDMFEFLKKFWDKAK